MGILDRWFGDASKRVERARDKATGADRPGWPGAVLVGAIGASLGAVAAFLFDPQRGRSRRAQLVDQGSALVRRIVRRGERAGRMIGSQAGGMMQALGHAGDRVEVPNDQTLAEKVETELFRNPKVPKGNININAEEGVIVLRGEVPDESMRRKLERDAAKIEGVEDVRNLLHVGPG
jgi:BON domain